MAIHIIAWLYFIYIHLLVGGFTPSEKYDFVSWDDEIPNRWKIMEKYNSCSKPPTRYYRLVILHLPSGKLT